MAFAIAEVSGSKMITKPEKSSLSEADLHLGQTEPVDNKRHSLHAFSGNF
jgi:uncharacterized ParB-like nuclease family protein